MAWHRRHLARSGNGGGRLAAAASAHRRTAARAQHSLAARWQRSCQRRYGGGIGHLWRWRHRTAAAAAAARRRHLYLCWHGERANLRKGGGRKALHCLHFSFSHLPHHCIPLPSTFGRRTCYLEHSYSLPPHTFCLLSHTFGPSHLHMQSAPSTLRLWPTPTSLFWSLPFTSSMPHHASTPPDLCATCLHTLPTSNLNPLDRQVLPASVQAGQLQLLCWEDIPASILLTSIYVLFVVQCWLVLPLLPSSRAFSPPHSLPHSTHFRQSSTYWPYSQLSLPHEWTFI